MIVLLVEDDTETAAYIGRSLKEHGHVVNHAATGREGLLLATQSQHDLLIVDRMLPGMDGLALVKTLRGAGSAVPILLLTTLSGIDDRVEGLNAGADDYLVKPFAFSELLARLNALARRPPPAQVQTMLQVGDLKVDLLRRKVTRGNEIIDLQPREFQLLEFLMRHADQIVTRTMLLEGVWEFHFDPKTNVVETHISRLRSKVDRGRHPELIQTIRGAGYSLRAPT